MGKMNRAENIYQFRRVNMHGTLTGPNADPDYREKYHPGSGSEKKYPYSGEKVNTDRFIKWFGDSVVVDRLGEPLIVYHGSNTGWAENIFDPMKGKSFGGWNSVGTWHTDQVIHAEIMSENLEGWGQLFPNYVKIENPMEGTWEEIVSFMQYKLQQAGTDQYTKGAGLVLRESLQDLGYDGIVIRNFEGDGPPAQDLFVPFESNQIKSAIANTGDYDPDNPDITMGAKR